MMVGEVRRIEFVDKVESTDRLALSRDGLARFVSDHAQCSYVTQSHLRRSPLSRCFSSASYGYAKYSRTVGSSSEIDVNPNQRMCGAVGSKTQSLTSMHCPTFF